LIMIDSIGSIQYCCGFRYPGGIYYIFCFWVSAGLEGSCAHC